MSNSILFRSCLTHDIVVTVKLFGFSTDIFILIFQPKFVSKDNIRRKNMALVAHFINLRCVNLPMILSTRIVRSSDGFATNVLLLVFFLPEKNPSFFVPAKPFFFPIKSLSFFYFQYSYNISSYLRFLSLYDFLRR